MQKPPTGPYPVIEVRDGHDRVFQNAGMESKAGEVDIILWKGEE